MIPDLEIVLSWLDEEGFLRLVPAKADTEYWGWLLPTLQRQFHLQIVPENRYPFDVG